MLFRLLMIFGLIFGSSGAVMAQKQILVFAAASLKNVLEVIGHEFESNCACKVVFSFAGSGTLARHLEAGAPADLFVSANVEWMDWLRERNVVQSETVKNIATNRLIVAVGRDRQISAFTGLPEILGNARIAMANPASVPAGKYGQEALEYLEVWETTKKRFVFGENVRVVLALVARGDVESAIVYRSDLAVEPRVKMAYLFDASTHEPIEYPAAMVRNNQVGVEFLGFLQTKDAISLFQKFGFTVADND